MICLPWRVKVNKTNSSVRFWILGESMARQSAFEINWPLVKVLYSRPRKTKGTFWKKKIISLPFHFESLVVKLKLTWELKRKCRHSLSFQFNSNEKPAAKFVLVCICYIVRHGLVELARWARSGGSYTHKVFLFNQALFME